MDCTARHFLCARCRDQVLLCSHCDRGQQYYSWAVLFLFSMRIGLLHPPFGMLAITMKLVAPKHITMMQIYVAAIPYVIITFLMMVAVLFYPPLATWLPKMFE